MTNNLAYQRAVKAVWRAWKQSEAFDHGGLASHEIVELIIAALRVEFGLPKKRAPV